LGAVHQGININIGLSLHVVPYQPSHPSTRKDATHSSAHAGAIDQRAVIRASPSAGAVVAAARSADGQTDLLDATRGLPGGEIQACGGVRDDAGPCERHDFGYRNYKLQERFSEANRAKIDDVFRKDLDDECAKRESLELLACRELAEIYFGGVRRLGDVDTDVDSLGDVVDLIGDIFDKRAEEMQGSTA
jgi:hypothetical protein